MYLCQDTVPLRHIIGTGELIEEKGLVEFHLLFEGSLPSAGSASEKHAIRRMFHPQLRQLWTASPNLRQLAMQKGFNAAALVGTEEASFERGVSNIGKNWSRGGYNLVPLVTPEMTARCSLDILLLRPEHDRYILKSGDTDNKLKTLFDALRLPSNAAETGGTPQLADEDPLFCLLEDDGLISEVKVSTDQLLMLPNTRRLRADDAYAVIKVRVNHKNARTFDNYFG